MGKKVIYERWINLFLPDGWTEREDMGFILLEKEGWPGLLQLSFIERDVAGEPSGEAAKALLEDILEERDVPFPREAIRAEDQAGQGLAVIDYTINDTKNPTHWRIWLLADRTRAIMAAYICDPEHDGHVIEEAAGIMADVELIAPAND